MNKRKRQIMVLLIFILVFICMLNFSYADKSDKLQETTISEVYQNPTNSEELHQGTYSFWSFMTQNSNQIMALTSMINLLIVLVIFIYDRWSRKEDIKVKRIAFWFDSIMLSPKKLDIVNVFFEKSNEILNIALRSYGHEDQVILIKDGIYQFQILKRDVVNKFNNLLRIVNIELSYKLDDILDDYEDKFTAAIETLLNLEAKDPSELRYELAEHRKCFEEITNGVIEQFFSIIYNFELNGYKLKKE